MILLGHIGITAAAARAVDRDIDLRGPILLSIAPDIIDKPLSVFFPVLVNENTRSFAHSLLGSLVAFALLWAFLRRPRRAALLGCCFLGHCLLDRMWRDEFPITFFWPFLGSLPTSQDVGALFGPRLFTPYNLIGEAVGLILILYMARRHRLFEKPRLMSFMRTGLLAG